MAESVIFSHWYETTCKWAKFEATKKGKADWWPSYIGTKFCVEMSTIQQT